MCTHARTQLRERHPPVIMRALQRTRASKRNRPCVGEGKEDRGETEGERGTRARKRRASLRARGTLEGSNSLGYLSTAEGRPADLSDLSLSLSLSFSLSPSLSLSLSLFLSYSLPFSLSRRPLRIRIRGCKKKRRNGEAPPASVSLARADRRYKSSR